MKTFLIRAASGLVYASLLVCGSMLFPPLLYAVLTVFLLLGMQELFRLLQIHISTFHFTILGLTWLSILYFLLVLTNRDLTQFPISEYLLLSIVVFASTYIFSIVLSRLPARDLMGAFTSSFFYLLVPTLSVIVLQQTPMTQTIPWLMAVLAIIWINDTMAYIIGSLVGKHKLIERVSPGKTIEGVVGGLVFSLAMVLTINELFLDLSIFTLALITVVVVVSGTFGDLLESKLKRDAGVKDSGSIMPGHGGILDRLDSLLVAAPIAILVLTLLREI